MKKLASDEESEGKRDITDTASSIREKVFFSTRNIYNLSLNTEPCNQVKINQTISHCFDIFTGSGT